MYDVNKRNIRLLDDGLPYDTHDPLSRFNFGTSPELLFKPCDEIGTETDSCFIVEGGKSYAYDPIIRLNKNTVSRTAVPKKPVPPLPVLDFVPTGVYDSVSISSTF